jgi:hypothetical protein
VQADAKRRRAMPWGRRERRIINLLKVVAGFLRKSRARGVASSDYPDFRYLQPSGMSWYMCQLAHHLCHDRVEIC